MSFIKSVPSPLSRVHRSINCSMGFASMPIDTKVRVPSKSSVEPDEDFFASQNYRANESEIFNEGSINEAAIPPTGNYDELAALKEANHRLAAELGKYQAHARAAYLAENSVCGGIAVFGRQKTISNLRQSLIEAIAELETVKLDNRDLKEKHQTAETAIADANRELEAAKKEQREATKQLADMHQKNEVILEKLQNEVDEQKTINEAVATKLSDKIKEMTNLVNETEEKRKKETAVIEILEKMNADKDLLIEDGKAKVVALEAMVEYWNQVNQELLKHRQYLPAFLNKKLFHSPSFSKPSDPAMSPSIVPKVLPFKISTNTPKENIEEEDYIGISTRTTVPSSDVSKLNTGTSSSAKAVASSAEATVASPAKTAKTDVSPTKSCVSPALSVVFPAKKNVAEKKSVAFDINLETLPEPKMRLPLTPMPSTATNNNKTPLSLRYGFRRSARKQVKTIFFSPTPSKK